MLAHISRYPDMSPEDVEIDLSLTDIADRPVGSVWSDHPFLLRGYLRDGTGFSLALNKTECARLYLLFRADTDIRDWAAVLEQRTDLSNSMPVSSSEH